jgi:hypothetical protein
MTRRRSRLGQRARQDPSATGRAFQAALSATPLTHQDRVAWQAESRDLATEKARERGSEGGREGREGGRERAGKGCAPTDTIAPWQGRVPQSGCLDGMSRHATDSLARSGRDASGGGKQGEQPLLPVSSLRAGGPARRPERRGPTRRRTCRWPLGR